MSGDGDPVCDCKVGTAVERYGLAGLPAELERRHEDGASLRDLAEAVNVRVVEAALDGAEADVAGDAASVYAALEGEDASVDRRVAVEENVASVGVDVGTLRSDFVSYGTVRRHLRDCVGRDTGREGVDSAAEGRQVVEHARDRCERVVEQTLERLRRVGVLSTGSLSVRTAVRVTCADCDRTYSVTELLTRRECHCDREDGDETPSTTRGDGNDTL